MFEVFKRIILSSQVRKRGELFNLVNILISSGARYAQVLLFFFRLSYFLYVDECKFISTLRSEKHVKVKKLLTLSFRLFLEFFV